MQAGPERPLTREQTARLGEVTGVDLAGYRTDGVLRRARQRAALVGADGLEAYLPLVDAQEGRALRGHVLAQVSGWFRDAHVWVALREVVLPGLAARRGGRVPLRAWVAGCGEGQEVWSLAAVLAEAAAAGHVASWDLLATDVDDGVLATARRAVYPAVGLPADGAALLAPHLDPVGGCWRVLPSLSAHVRTVRHDVRDAPPEELGGPADLVLCRNLLMYLDTGVQGQVLDGLVASLRPGGVLVLGQAELPLQRREVLVPVDLPARAYRSIAVPLARSRAPRRAGP